MKHHWKFGLIAGMMLLLPLALATTTVTTASAAAKNTTTKTAKKAKPKAKKHYLIVMGHGAGDPGARGNGTTEATFLRKRMLPQLRKYAKKVKGSAITFYNPKKNLVSDTLYHHKGSYKINKKTTVIMFHLDAPAGHGGHVIIHKKHPTKRDRRLAKVIKKYVGLNKAYNGYSYRTNLRNCNVLRRRGIDYSLVESGFITNKSDVKHLKKHMAKIAKADIEAITNEHIK
ncbi:N-acetylmuramoyl-L-alanine amidase [Levilactobacillus tujiorum]|uniref:N-acetylmuramoyl-L-alanine amidase n=1 Tax=Levilactobacillus tujiorum TaxID=2912243 RepID=A0ABX1L2Z4_9LACO|nr:N-acetylmuramoyl-L-alanine amidase [Levilactobacillus tujiorum]MCH5464415.1 N-acetylmuramoyl-L-alanine amidase [Levilactobacillus tujiorum]NLR11435.1 N-acetylmuramoyl-L-alanine amidase [Lactobacillus sp. HBUAS51387]NLR29395.1 N-acetylmuramoyl-L-alanine amidase [Levilactobacillus tujiorum]